MDKATELEAALALLQPRPLLLLSTLEVEREPHRAVVTVLAPSRAAQKLARLVAPKRVAEGSARHDTRVRARARQRPVGWREETPRRDKPRADAATDTERRVTNARRFKRCSPRAAQI